MHYLVGTDPPFFFFFFFRKARFLFGKTSMKITVSFFNFNKGFFFFTIFVQKSYDYFKKKLNIEIRKMLFDCENFILHILSFKNFEFDSILTSN